MTDLIVAIRDFLAPWNEMAQAVHTAGNLVFLPGCAVVVYLFHETAMDTLRILVNERRVPSRHMWMSLGIYLSFMSKTLDGMFWSSAWGSRLYDLEVWPALFDLGVWSNLPFRLTLGVLTMACHIAAVKLSPSDGDYLEEP